MAAFDILSVTVCQMSAQSSEAKALLQEELWARAAAALESGSGRKVPEDLLLSACADTFVSRGKPCLPALRCALSAPGHSLSLDELRQMTPAELKQRIVQVPRGTVLEMTAAVAMYCIQSYTSTDSSRMPKVSCAGQILCNGFLRLARSPLVGESKPSIL